MTILALLLPLVFGWLVARGLLNVRPAWALHLMCGALAVALGAGWASIAQFLLLWTGVAQPVVLIAADGVACAAAYFLFRGRAAIESGEERALFPYLWMGWLVLAATVAICLIRFSSAWHANPLGDWDAFSIWNVRAKWLASSDAWRIAVQPTLEGANYGVAHPGYPLLLSGFIAHIWQAGGTADAAWPMIVALLFTLAAAALLAGALAAGRSETAGVLGAALLLGTDLYVMQGPRQYSDVPLSVFLLGAVALAALAWQRDWAPGALALSGACTALAWWTKNEAIAFVAAMAMVVAWNARRRALAFLWGALPVLTVMAAFRLALAPMDFENVMPTTLAGVWAQVVQFGRWETVLKGYLLPEWLLPLACLAIAAWVLRQNRQEGLWRAFWLLLPIGALKFAGFFVFLVTMTDQQWHVATAASRLQIQLWPAAILALLWGMGRPEDFAEAVPVKGGKRSR